MKNWSALTLFFLLFFVSCSDKYLAFKSKYSFRSNDGNPHYEDLNYWAAHPWKWDPSDSVPAPLKMQPKDTLVDVFFIHPTTFTKKKFKKISNASIDDAYINAKTDYSSILYQASVFNQHARIFAPRYRQGHIRNFFIKDKDKAKKAFDLAYEDVKNAFEYYIRNWNHDRPIIIASHSQGSLLAERLLKNYFENRPLQDKLVVAYILGWPVPKDYTKPSFICSDSLQTGCLCSWRTLRKGYTPWYLRKEDGNSYVTNPLTWTTSEEFVSRNSNKGSILKKFNKLYIHTADAQIKNGLLFTRKPKFPGSFLIPLRNYHVGDINLYYLNLRINIEQRIRSYFKRAP